MIHMLDTDICIYLIKENRSMSWKGSGLLDLLRWPSSWDTVAELQYGAYKSSWPERNQEALAEFLLPLEVVSFDESAAAHYGEIRTYLERKGNMIGAMDLLIAAHAKPFSHPGDKQYP